MSIADRLKEERERLGFNQTAFAELVGATKKTLFNWEHEAGSPSAEALAVWVTVGLDAPYLLTGERNPRVPALDPAERVLLDSYRRCAEQAKQHLIQTAALLSAGLGPAVSSQAAGHQQNIGTGAGMVNHGDGAVQIGHAAGKVKVKRGQ